MVADAGNRRQALGDQDRRGRRGIERQKGLAPFPDPFFDEAQIEAIFAETRRIKRECGQNG